MGTVSLGLILERGKLRNWELDPSCMEDWKVTINRHRNTIAQLTAGNGLVADGAVVMSVNFAVPVEGWTDGLRKHGHRRGVVRAR